VLNDELNEFDTDSLVETEKLKDVLNEFDKD
jgi:hypothetical protein